jgi:hypothetical protein
MKKLLILIFSSLLFSGEMEVDGNLKVTGTVESTTIDSLKAVIADLQAQLAALNGYSTCLLRMSEFSGSPADDKVHLALQYISGSCHQLDYPKIHSYVTSKLCVYLVPLIVPANLQLQLLSCQS